MTAHSPTTAGIPGEAVPARPAAASTSLASPSLAALLVLADGRLPAGGHAHSGGLESAVAAGRLRDLDGLAAFLAGRLATAGRVAAAFAAGACAAARAADPPGAAPPPPAAHPPSPADPPRAAPPPPVAPPPPAAPPLPAADPPRAAHSPGSLLPGLDELDGGLDARTPSPALRHASRAQGRALLRAGRAIWPVGAGPARPHHPVALGMVASAAGLGPVEAALTAAYGTVAGPASAAVRLLGLDPYAVHAQLAGLAAECDRLAAEAAARVGDPVDELPADSAPLLEIGAELHASREVRLFAS